MINPRRLKPLSETFGEAPAVGVVADEIFALDDNGVDRADGCGVLGQAIEGCDHALLEGMRDVEPGVAGELQLPDEAPELGVLEFETIKIEEPIFVAKAETCALGFMHPRRKRLLNPAAEQARAQHRTHVLVGRAIAQHGEVALNVAEV